MQKLILLLLLVPVLSIAQKKQITLEDIYKTKTFHAEPIKAIFEDSPPNPKINIAELRDENGKLIGKVDDTIYSTVHPRIVLIRTHVEPIYRRSSKANVYIYDSLTKKVTTLDEAQVLHPTLSPDGSKVAYVKNNNLYIKDIATNSIKAVTTDGKWNYIINGNCDWVYEEEFEFSRAYQWSPQGNYIAYYRFDETEVKEYNMTIYDNAYNKDYRYKYPKAGEVNSKVEIHIYDISKDKYVKARYEQGDIYIPRIKWTNDDKSLVVFWMNRRQNHLKLLLTNAETGDHTVLYEETNKYFVEINDDWWFLNDRKNFLFTSEMDGYRHLYLYSMDGKTKTQVTRGNYEVTELNGVDEANQRIFFTVAYPRPMDRNFFVSDFEGKKTIPLTRGEGWHRITMNHDFTQVYDFKSDINNPDVVTLHNIVSNKKGEISILLAKTVSESEKLKNKLNEYETSKAAFIRVPNSKGDTLNGWMLKPPHFDPSKKYPLLFCNYGGPGSQRVFNRFGAVSYWHRLSW